MTELDKIFKERIEGFEKEPSGEVWREIRSRISHQRPYTRYIKIAATIALIAVSFWLGYSIKDSGDQKSRMEQAASTQPALEENLLISTVEETQETKKEESATPAQKQESVVIVKNSRPEINRPLEEVVSVEPLYIQKKPVNEHITLASFNYQIVQGIEVRFEPVDLIELNPVSDSTNAFQKLFALALEVKSGGTGLGDIRDFKNSILSFERSKSEGDQ